MATTSPGYFGLVVESNDSSVHSVGGSDVPKNVWTPTSHTVRSPAKSPQNFRIGSNSGYEAFRKSSDHNKVNTMKTATTPKLDLAANAKIASRREGSRHASKATTPSLSKPLVSGNHKYETIGEGELPSQLRSPKRVLSTDSSTFPGSKNRQAQTSPDDLRSGDRSGSPQARRDDKQPRLSPPRDAVLPSSAMKANRSGSVPANTNLQEPLLASIERVAELLKSSSNGVLVLDLRVATYYARARLKDSLNLCIPTTLLKRASYNVERLADTFKDEAQKARFSDWKNCKTIVVYDGSSTSLLEAGTCLNIIKKFASEGWKGESLVVRGGFDAFSRKFPNLVETEATLGSETDSGSSSDANEVPPVIGGCPMPATKNAANPFFGNIRQNTDLIGGVGQFAVHCPPAMSKMNPDGFPNWLRDAADEHDKGKKVSDKFLGIEKREQARMREALSGNVSYTSPRHEAPHKVRIAGIEKGSKNRYNNIWPYEHSRVKLKGVAPTGCDYVNANFLTTSLSNKKYIATQGPIPATFNDFWNMVWQRDIRVLLMLTAESEGGQLKAHNYWSSKHYGSLRLDFLSEHRVSLEPTQTTHARTADRHHERPELSRRRSSHVGAASSASTPGSRTHAHPPPSSLSPSQDQQYVIVRNFTLSHDAEPFSRIRDVTQLQFPHWPDFGAPASPANLLGLVEQCNKIVRASSGTSRTQTGPDPPTEHPVLVHCSAGCGRTGTFCTVDTVLDALKRQQNHKPRAARHTSPMDLDDPSSSPSGAAPTPKSDANPFFTPIPKHSHSRSVATANKDLESDWLGREDVDLVEKVVEELRHQRISMVQSLRQYVLCYETVLEWIVGEGAEPRTA
ncbi:MAG: hypothetical protein M1828_003337 [Chrysothrix sp. TS-e1954]|nr:MAG: hypothetical protein M1828_003337 [Chrysothrix sp. TS-e1954]